MDRHSDRAPATLLRRCLAQGAVGLKPYPSCQFFYPDERRGYPIDEVAQEAGIPILRENAARLLRLDSMGDVAPRAAGDA